MIQSLGSLIFDEYKGKCDLEMIKTVVFQKNKNFKTIAPFCSRTCSKWFPGVRERTFWVSSDLEDFLHFACWMKGFPFRVRVKIPIILFFWQDPQSEICKYCKFWILSFSNTRKPFWASPGAKWSYGLEVFVFLENYRFYHF